MKTKLIIAVLALLMTSGAAPVHAGGKPVPEGNPWARAIGDIRTLEDDHVGCSTQDDMALVNAILRNTLESVWTSLLGARFSLVGSMLSSSISNTLRRFVG